MDEQQLSTHLEPELLRGVPLHECLSGLGKHWKSSANGSYELSRPLDYFDDFLSHDWQTSGRLKLLSLLIIYNSRAALVATFLTAVVLGVIRGSEGFMPSQQRWVFAAICYGVHIFFLCFWQNFRRLLFIRSSPQFVFLDKLCIAQSPELAHLKKKGILGLAAFLDISKRLVVVWSPRYFQRLWCCYEVASYLRGSNQHKPLVVMPAHGGLILFLEYLAWSGVASGFWLVQSEVIDRNQSLFSTLAPFRLILIAAACIISFAACFAVPLLAWAIALARHVTEVREQLRAFRMQDTLCLCCSKGHRDPDTGAVIPCDRELVYMKLKEWYGQPTDTDGEFLSRFNILVQTSLADSVLNKMSNLLPRRYALYMMAAANLPWLPQFVVNIIQRTSYSKESAVMILRDFMQWGMLSMVLLLGSWCERFIALNLGVPLARYMPRLCAGILLFPICAVPVIVFLGSFWFLLLTNPAATLEAIPFAILSLLLLCYGGNHLAPQCRSETANLVKRHEAAKMQNCTEPRAYLGHSSFCSDVVHPFEAH